MTVQTTLAPRFSLGQVVATPGAMDVLGGDPEKILSLLRRHRVGDWGDVCPEDHRANEIALLDGSRIFSVYHTESGEKVWVITEWDRSATTLLLPSEY